MGGSVRDLILGKSPKDFDVATDATPEQVLEVFPSCRLIGRRFRLAHVRIKGALIEVATFRGEQTGSRRGSEESGNGRILRDNTWGSIEEDALRRDFTINALYLDPANGDIRDYAGGYSDLAERRLKLIGDPETRYREDPVRLLRACRFIAKLGVEPDTDTAEPITRLAHLLADIPPARLFEEVCKLFLTGHSVGSFDAMQRYHLAAVMFPQLCNEKNRVVLGPLLEQALLNTDSRIKQEKPVTPAFLYAALLWQPYRKLAESLEAQGELPVYANQQAAEMVIATQVQRTAIPRRFSIFTRQVWLLQPRFKHTRGRRVSSLLNERKFRAAYDFLLLRAYEDQSLKELCDFWTRIQEHPPEKSHSNYRNRRQRCPNKRKREAARSQGRKRNSEGGRS